MRVPMLMLSLSLLVAPAFAADELGRLFFTPEQRAILDLARSTQSSAAQVAAEAYEGVTLSGVVTRSDGKRTVWVNGQPQAMGDGGGAGRSPASASIPLPGGEGRIRLKVGQTLDPTSGKVEEGYRRTPKLASEPQTTPPAPSAAPAKATAAKLTPRATAPGGNDENADDLGAAAQ